MKSTLIALVEDKPGVLNRVASLFRRRAFNIESLTVGHTEQPGVSRMTIVVDSARTDVRKVAQNLYKLVNVIQVEDVTERPAVIRDLALIKVRTNGSTRAEVMQIVETFRARVVDVGLETLMVEVTGTEEKIDGLVEVLGSFGIVEMVRTGRVTRDEFPLEKAREVLSDEVVAVLGYGVQGPAQALNMKDNGINVIVGGSPERKRSWEKAIKDGWEPGKTLFPLEEAVEKATIIQYLVSDAAQMILWPRIKPPTIRRASCPLSLWT